MEIKLKLFCIRAGLINSKKEDNFLACPSSKTAVTKNQCNFCCIN